MVEQEPCSPDEDGRADTLAAEVLVSLSGRSSADEYSQVRTVVPSLWQANMLAAESTLLTRSAEAGGAT